MENSHIPTRNRLVAASMFAPTEEERLAARRLLEAGLFRATSKDDVAWEDHPFNLAGLYPGDDSPFGKLIEDLVSQSEELIDEDLAIHVTDKVPLLPLPLPPKPAAPVEDANTLTETMRLRQEQLHKPIRRPVIPPSWSVANPTPVQDLGERQPLNW
jgi:hypothetical protein